MSGPGNGGDWMSSGSRLVVSIQTSGPPARPPASRSRGSAKSKGAYVWIVMSLLIASTVLALYDLYQLTSLVVSR